MRDAINSDEGARLVKAMKDGADWDEARTMLPGVDPEALDRGWKDYVHREAGVELVQLAPEGSDAVPPAGEEPSGDPAAAAPTAPAKAPKQPRQPKAPKQPKPTP